MAPTSAAWAATWRTRRTAWVRRIGAGLTALLGAAALVVFVATGGVDTLRQLAPSDTLRPVIGPIDGIAQQGSTVSTPATGTAGEPAEAPPRVEPPEPDPLPEGEGSGRSEDVAPQPGFDDPGSVDPGPAEPTSDEVPADEPDGDGERTGASPTEIQEQLRELGYLVGPADGVHGAQTRAAVMAFQRVNGLQVDGWIGPRTREALADPLLPELADGPATRIDVDLDRQLLHLVEGGERVVTLHVSSGSDQPYATASGGTAVSNTPVGEFTIERRIAGTRRAALGTLYDPLYFHRGWAIHGSNSVPAEPASHGCIRVTRADGRWLFERVPDGTPVHVTGGEHVFTPSGT
ncbi:MAG: L,D-transpeptidase family protein [Nitriliruptoraceae bacterium]